MSEDIITEMLEMAARECPEFTEPMALAIDKKIRQKWGGAQRAYIKKTPSTEAERKAEAKETAERNGRVRDTAKHYGIPLSTMYRELKRKR